MDPQQELPPLTSSVIGDSPIDYSKELLLRNGIHGTCDLLEDGPATVDNIDVRRARLVLESFDDRTVPIKHHRVGKTFSKERMHHSVKRLGNRGDVRHAVDVYSRPVTFVETPDPSFELFGARPIPHGHRGDLLLRKTVSAKNGILVAQRKIAQLLGRRCHRDAEADQSKESEENVHVVDARKHSRPFQMAGRRAIERKKANHWIAKSAQIAIG